MERFNTLRRTAVMVTGAALAASAVVATTSDASAVILKDGAPKGWGTFVPTAGCSQSNAWVISVKGLGGIVDTAWFESHSPATPAAPEVANGLKDGINLTFGGFGLGSVGAIYSRSIRDAKPADDVGGTIGAPDPCSAYAETTLAQVDVGIPYVKNPADLVGGGLFRKSAKALPITGLGVKADGIQVKAHSRKGLPVRLYGTAAAVKLYSNPFGVNKTPINIDPKWPVNLEVVIPPGATGKDVLVQASTNEWRTTDNLGKETLDANKKWFLDPTATSGYVNAIHASVFGAQAAEVIIGHAASIAGPADPAPTTPPVTPPVTSPPVTPPVTSPPVTPTPTVTPIVTPTGKCPPKAAATNVRCALPPKYQH